MASLFRFHVNLSHVYIPEVRRGHHREHSNAAIANSKVYFSFFLAILLYAWQPWMPGVNIPILVLVKLLAVFSKYQDLVIANAAFAARHMGLAVHVTSSAHKWRNLSFYRKAG